MAVYSSKDLALTIATHDVTAYLTKVGAAKIQAIIEESTPFGVLWPAHVATGISKMNDIAVGGIFDTTTSALVDLLRGQQGTTVACVLTIGGTKTFTFNAIVESTTDTPTVNKMTMFEANLRPTGTVTIA